MSFGPSCFCHGPPGALKVPKWSQRAKMEAPSLPTGNHEEGLAAEGVALKIMKYELLNTDSFISASTPGDIKNYHEHCSGAHKHCRGCSGAYKHCSGSHKRCSGVHKRCSGAGTGVVFEPTGVVLKPTGPVLEPTDIFFSPQTVLKHTDALLESAHTVLDSTGAAFKSHKAYSRCFTRPQTPFQNPQPLR